MTSGFVGINHMLRREKHRPNHKNKDHADKNQNVPDSEVLHYHGLNKVFISSTEKRNDNPRKNYRTCSTFSAFGALFDQISAIKLSSWVFYEALVVTSYYRLLLYKYCLRLGHGGGGR